MLAKMTQQENVIIPASVLFSKPRIPLTEDEVAYYYGVTDLYSEEDEEEEIGPETSPTSATPAPRFLKEYEIETSNPAPASSTNISTLMELDPSFHANIPNGLCELFKTMICDETKAETTHCANIIYDDEEVNQLEQSSSVFVLPANRTSVVLNTTLHRQTTSRRKYDASELNENDPAKTELSEAHSTLLPSFHANVPPGLFATTFFTNDGITLTENDTNCKSHEMYNRWNETTFITTSPCTDTAPKSLIPLPNSNKTLSSLTHLSLRPSIPENIRFELPATAPTTICEVKPRCEDKGGDTHLMIDETNTILKNIDQSHSQTTDMREISGDKATFISTTAIVPKESILFPRFADLDDVEDRLKSVQISHPQPTNEVTSIQKDQPCCIAEKEKQKIGEEAVQKSNRQKKIFDAAESKIVRPIFSLPCKPQQIQKSPLKRQRQLPVPLPQSQTLREIFLNYTTPPPPSSSPSHSERRKQPQNFQHSLLKQNFDSVDDSKDSTLYSDSSIDASLLASSPPRKVILQKGPPFTGPMSPLALTDRVKIDLLQNSPTKIPSPIFLPPKSGRRNRKSILSLERKAILRLFIENAHQARTKAFLHADKENTNAETVINKTKVDASSSSTKLPPPSPSGINTKRREKAIKLVDISCSDSSFSCEAEENAHNHKISTEQPKTLNETHLCRDSNLTDGAGSFIETNDSDNHALTDAPAHESALDSVFFQSNIHSADTDLSNSTNHLEISQSQSHVPSASYAEEITTSSCSNHQGNPINLSEISCPQSSPSANSSFASSTQHQSNDPLVDDANEAKEIDDENLISRIDLTFSSPLPLSIAITPSPTPPHPHRILSDTDVCFESALAEPGCSFVSLQETSTSPSPKIAAGDSIFFKSSIPYVDFTDSTEQQFDLLSSPSHSQSLINNDENDGSVTVSSLVFEEESVDLTFDRTDNNNSLSIKHYYKCEKQCPPNLVYQPKLIKKNLNSPSMHMGLRRSTRTRLARLPIGCHAIYKTNDNGDRELVGATEFVATDPLLKKHQMLDPVTAMEREQELRSRKRALRKRKHQHRRRKFVNRFSRLSEESSDSD